MIISTDTWKEIALALLAWGTLMGFILRGWFQTKKGCQQHQEKCGGQVCKKLTEIGVKREADKQEAIRKREQFEEKVFEAIDHNREVVNQHYSELQKFVGRVEEILERIKK